ncbi:wax ester/triacylglycerol synthase domain-containing protein [Streptomyces sp. NPDC097107]|uniref:wax ester/triacylglycerol synthase domain-containing protein n=1 Tax=Streptomyces sp. NPDC097107 TaxID=3366089 RepID=UPI0038164CDF
MDTLFWRMSAHERLRVEVVWVWFLDQTPEWGAFLSGCDWMTRAMPRLRHRVDESVLHIGVPHWSPDPDFRLSRHVHRMRLPAPGGLRELLDLVEWRASGTLDRRRPPWEATLVEGYADGRAAVVLKWHHAIADALGIQIAMRNLLPRSPRMRMPSVHASVPSPTDGNRVQSRNPLPRLGRTARFALQDAGTLLTAAAGESVRAMLASDEAGARLRRAARNLRSVVSPVEPSPLLRRRSHELHYGLVSVPLPGLRAAGKRTGVSVNSVFVAAILGAFHAYHRHHGLAHEAIPVMLPVSIREPSQPGAGNHVAAIRIAGHVGNLTPVERMLTVHNTVSRARHDLMDGLYPILAANTRWVPPPLFGLVAPVLAQGVDLVVTGVPGLAQDTYVAGARIVDAVPWAPRGPSAANITTASHGDMCGIGVNLDPAAVTAPDLFHRCLELSFEDVLTAPGR